jgi:hypothetical protein
MLLSLRFHRHAQARKEHIMCPKHAVACEPCAAKNIQPGNVHRSLHRDGPITSQLPSKPLKGIAIRKFILHLWQWPGAQVGFTISGSFFGHDLARR